MARKIRDLNNKKPISKPEDKQWLEWYNNLSPEEHRKHIKLLGLSDSDLLDLDFLSSKSSRRKKG